MFLPPIFATCFCTPLPGTVNGSLVLLPHGHAFSGPWLKRRGKCLALCPKELRPVPKVLASSQKRGNQDRPHAKSQAPSDHQKILGMRLVLIIQTYGLALLKALGINHNTPWLHPARDFPAMPRGKAAALLPQTEVMGSPAICPKL